MDRTNPPLQGARDLVLPAALSAAIASVLLWIGLHAVERDARSERFASVPDTIEYTATYAVTLGQGAPEPETLPGKVLLAALLLTWGGLAGVVAGTVHAIVRGRRGPPCAACAEEGRS